MHPANVQGIISTLNMLYVQHLCATIEACQLDEYTYNVVLLHELVDKLPSSIKVDWAKYRRTVPRVNLTTFSTWLYDLAEAVCPLATLSISDPRAARGKKETAYLNAHAGQANDGQQNRTIRTNKLAPPTPTEKLCPVCKASCPSVEKCARFVELGYNSRWATVKEFELCRKCLKKHKTACKSQQICGKNRCQFKHHQLLHNHQRESNTSSNTQCENNASTSSVPKSSEWQCNTHVKSTNETLFRVAPVLLHGPEKILKTYAFLDDGSSLTLMDATLAAELKLNGKLEPLCKEGKLNQPIATKTRLGWIIHGGSKPSGEFVGYHKTQRCSCDELNEAAVREYFAVENVGIYQPKHSLISTEDQRAIDILKSFKQTESGHYVSRLLWKYDNLRLPNSRSTALQRWRCLESRLKRDPELESILRMKLIEYCKKGYIRRLKEDELSQPRPRIWYLPIFPVFNPNKPGKVRIVWDAAAKTNGISLNSMLLTGPDLLTSLVSVLIKFRENKVAICGDVREMFHQVWISKEDQDCQRFLWKKNPTDESTQQQQRQ
ncbi:uncharacterized protein LOC129728410 [Wyeomyia smithii]|uniref:uncharacterized protein LOC129728410 n=1 Tax=Wyeomyia smithii TaxID=174621 RepID=UPI002467D8D6|nr:uncharacterized protein LOC129728410 [Wyeomyia smithii]